MEGGPPSFTPRYSVPWRYSGTPLDRTPPLHLPGCHRLWRPVPGDFGCVHPSASVGPTTPPLRRAPVWAMGPVRSPLLGASRLIPLPPGTEMFQFPGFASRRSVMTGLAPRRVSPFGHRGITARVQLPPAFRSLPRPSSPPCAQASPTCLRSLDHNVMKQSTRFFTSDTIEIVSLVLILIPRITTNFCCQTAVASQPSSLR